MSNKILLLHRTWFLLCFPYSIGTEFMVWRQVSRKSRTQMWILKKNKNSLSIQKQHLNNQQSNSHAEKNKLYVLYHYFVSRYGFCCSSVNSPHSKQRTDNEWTKKMKKYRCLCTRAVPLWINVMLQNTDQLPFTSCSRNRNIQMYNVFAMK